MQRQQLNYQQANSKYIDQLKEQEFRKAFINTQLVTIEEKLGSLVAVTAPFNGTIRKIIYESQNNNFIVAVATLDTTNKSPNTNANESASLPQLISGLPGTAIRISYGKL